MKYFAETHEWHEESSGIVTIGISRFAIDELTDITYLEFTVEVGDVIEASQPFAEIESVKATNEVYSGVAGEVVELNQSLLDDVEMINKDSECKAWLCKIKISHDGIANLPNLVPEDDYRKNHS